MIGNNNKGNPVRDILVIQLTKMGDILQTTPLVYQIRKAFPEARISILGDTRFKDVVNGIPFVDRAFFLDISKLHGLVNDSDTTIFSGHKEIEKMLGGIRACHFDLIYNINFSRITALICLLLRYDRIIGYRFDHGSNRLIKEPWAGFVFHLMGHRKMLRFNLVDLLASYQNNGRAPCTGLAFETDGAECSLPDSKNSDFFPVIGLQMGCGGDLRRWPKEYFASLAHMLIKRLNARIVLFGSKGEKHLSDSFFQEWDKISGKPPENGRIVDFIGKTGISELAACLKRCDLLVTGDTGTMHLASAVGTRVLALFMASAFCHETGPYGEGHYVVQPAIQCFPCTQGRNSCKHANCRWMIKPGTVYKLVSGIIPDNGEPGKIRGRIKDQEIQIYRSHMDKWGVKFLPLIPELLDTGGLMALAYREAGRKIMRPLYNFSIDDLKKELSDYYSGIDQCIKEQAGLVMDNLKEIYSACSSCTGNPGYKNRLDVERRIFNACTSVDFLRPLAGYFSDMRHWIEYDLGQGEEGKVTEYACQAMQGTVDTIMAVTDAVLSMPG